MWCIFLSNPLFIIPHHHVFLQIGFAMTMSVCTPSQRTKLRQKRHTYYFMCKERNKTMDVCVHVYHSTSMCTCVFN